MRTNEHFLMQVLKKPNQNPVSMDGDDGFSVASTQLNPICILSRRRISQQKRNAQYIICHSFFSTSTEPGNRVDLKL
jgi:hypothetical protein